MREYVEKIEGKNTVTLFYHLLTARIDSLHFIQFFYNGTRKRKHVVVAHKKGLSGKKNKRSQNTLKEKKKITPLGVCDGDEVETIFSPGGLQ